MKFLKLILSCYREIHYHVKVEIEKKTLERQEDFNTVSSFTIIDDHRQGYLDFENLKRYLTKFKRDVKKPDLNSIIRRMDLDGDGKISF
jgi:Ca2+-binding EF-hand superfamily protein